MITDINSEDRLVQKTFADHLRDRLGWESIYAWNEETFGPSGILGRTNEREAVLVRDLREALVRLNPDLPELAREQAVEKLARGDFAARWCSTTASSTATSGAVCRWSGATPRASRGTHWRR